MLHVHKNLKQRLLSGGAWSFITKAGLSFLTVALAAIIARLLPPADVGVFFLSFSIIVLLSLFARFGLDRFCVRYIGDDLAAHHYLAARELVYVVMRIVFCLSLTISLLLYFLFDVFILEHFLREDIGFNISIYLAIWLPVATFQFLFAEIFRAYHNIKYASLFSAGTIFGGFMPSLLFGLVVIVGYITESSYYLDEVLQMLFSIMIVLLVIEYRIMRKMINKYCELDDSKSESKRDISLKKIFHDAYPFFISSLSFMFLLHADTVILGFYEQETEVAVYNATTRLAKLAIIIFMIINEVIMPVIVELNTKGEKEKLEKMFRATAIISVVFSLLSLLLFIFFGELLLTTIYGEYYKDGALLLVIMGAGQLITVSAGSSEIALNMMGFQKVNMYISLVTSVVAVLACILIAPLYGSVAVASVIAAALIFRGVISTLFVYKLSGVRVYVNIFMGVSDFKELVKYAKS